MQYGTTYKLPYTLWTKCSHRLQLWSVLSTLSTTWSVQEDTQVHSQKKNYSDYLKIAMWQSTVKAFDLTTRIVHFRILFESVSCRSITPICIALRQTHTVRRAAVLCNLQRQHHWGGLYVPKSSNSCVIPFEMLVGGKCSRQSMGRHAAHWQWWAKTDRPAPDKGDRQTFVSKPRGMWI